MHGTPHCSVSERGLGKPRPCQPVGQRGQGRCAHGQAAASSWCGGHRGRHFSSVREWEGVGMGNPQMPSFLMAHQVPWVIPATQQGTYTKALGRKGRTGRCSWGQTPTKTHAPLLDKASPSSPQGCNERSGGPKTSSLAPGTSTHTWGFQPCSSSAYAETFGREQRVLLLEFPAD